MRQLLSDNVEAREQWLPLKQSHSIRKARYIFLSVVLLRSSFTILRTCTSNQIFGNVAQLIPGKVKPISAQR